MDVGTEIRRVREAKGWSQAKLAGASDMGVSGISQIETGARNPSVVTLSKIAEALGVEVADLFPKAQSPLPLEAPTGRSPEERAEIARALASAVAYLGATHRGALEELSDSGPDELFALYMQASLINVGARAIAEDAGYADVADDATASEQEAAQSMRAALQQLEEASDEIEQAMASAEAAQELPEGVAWFARYRRAG
jgi:transcriptional regulator with XRE-family HTH domain